MDSLRADRIRAFNPKARAETPNFDKLAERSAVFLQNYVQGNESQVSHAVDVDVDVPRQAQVPQHEGHAAGPLRHDRRGREEGRQVRRGRLGQRLHPARSAASARRGTSSSTTSRAAWGSRASTSSTRACRSSRRRRTSRGSSTSALIDTHVTLAREVAVDRQVRAGLQGPVRQGLRRRRRGRGAQGPDRRREGPRPALYDSNVSYQDDLLGKLLAKLEEWGIYDQTMIIITADHGDELWEDGRVRPRRLGCARR